MSWLALACLGVAWYYLPAGDNITWQFAAEAVGLALVIAAVLGRVWCALYIAGRKNAELCQDGPYSLVRNPLYVFSFLGAMGVALAANRWGLPPMVAGLYVAYYALVVRAEEARLAELFPQAYAEYQRTVPRCLPRLHGYRTRTQLTLDPRDVTRAMREVVWFPAAFLLIAACARLA